MKFPHAVVYAINAMLKLAEAEAGVPVSCRQIASADEMPERFLLQVLRTLVNHGLLCSIRGVDGGYYLARPATVISLCDILDVFDNPLEPKLPDLHSPSNVARKRVALTMRHAAEAARAELEKMSLAELVERNEIVAGLREKLEVE